MRSGSSKTKPVKPSANRTAASSVVFDPAVFLATAALGRDISTHSKKEVIFAQGEDADAVFYRLENSRTFLLRADEVIE